MSDTEVSDGGESYSDLPESGGYRVLRIWPAVLFLIVMVVARTIHWLPAVAENGPSSIWMASAFGPLLCGVLAMLWWLFASRATVGEKAVGLLGVIALSAITIALVDRSLHGPPIVVLTIPLGIAAFVTGTLLFSRVLAFRRVLMALVLGVVGFGFSTALRNHGMWGNFGMELDWRWVPSGEDKLAQRSEVATVSLADLGDVQTGLDNPEWPAFRGANRDGRVEGAKIDTDWTSNPPKPLWKIDVGPGWSSFAVAGELIFTQEQRGDLETVVCYAADSGQEVWTYTVESRFIDALGGDGPRATPTIADGDLFVLGATGHMLRLDAKTGAKKWGVDLRELAGRQPPMWGFCSSPLVVGNVVIVHAGGSGNKGILAMHIDTGEVVWSVPSGGHSYGSPQLSNLLGAQYVAMLTDDGLDLVDPESGDVKLAYEWKHGSGYRSLQPLVVGDNKVLLPTGMGVGTQCVVVADGDDGLIAEEEWTTLRLKPDFNDMVVHDGAIYGFDGDVFTCVDVESGDRNWKRGRYGKGQVMLLADQDLLLVLTETGEVILLETNSDKHVEVVKMEMIEGRTWTHPVLIGDRLYLRNSSQAVCYQLPTIPSFVETVETAIEVTNP